jgi:hypothetical protein
MNRGEISDKLALIRSKPGVGSLTGSRSERRLALIPNVRSYGSKLHDPLV